MNKSDVQVLQATADGRGPNQTHYRDALGWAGIAIDREVAESEPCPECGVPMKYEAVFSGGSYRAFAVCTNLDCGEAQEF